MTESEIRSTAKKELEKLGYTVMVISDSKKSHNTRGCPDMFVSKNRNRWVAIETKASKTSGVRPEQEKLIDRGLVYLCYTVEDIVATAIEGLR